MIVICGTQRSGTTVLAQFLQKNNYFMGPNTFYDNSVNGGLESPYIAWFIREIVQDRNFPFTDFDSFFQGERKKDISQIGNFFDFQKSSYLLMDPLFIEKYLDVNPSHRFIVLLREAHKVYASKQKYKEQFSKDAPILQQKPEIISYNLKRSIEVLTERRAKTLYLHFPQFLLNKNETAEKLKSFDVLLKKDWAIIWDELVDYEKISYL
jgi:hypothetical protein